MKNHISQLRWRSAMLMGSKHTWELPSPLDPPFRELALTVRAPSTPVLCTEKHKGLRGTIFLGKTHSQVLTWVGVWQPRLPQSGTCLISSLCSWVCSGISLRLRNHLKFLSCSFPSPFSILLPPLPYLLLLRALPLINPGYVYIGIFISGSASGEVKHLVTVNPLN